MRYPIILTLFFLFHINLTAQDSLRLTFKLEGFKDKDVLRVELIDGVYNLPTDKNKLTIFRKLDSPTQLSIMYKSRFKSFWLDNSDIEIYIPKSNFFKGTTFSGSASQKLWDSLIAASKEEIAQILEENIDSKVALRYLSSRSYELLPHDRERLLTMVPIEVKEQANYGLSGISIDKKSKVKEGDMIFDFTAKNAESKEFSTKDFRGEYLLLDFASTGCGPCWMGYPDLIEIQKKYSTLNVITFNQDFSIEAWEKQAERRNIEIEWPVLWVAENKREIFEKYGIDGWPYFFLISPEGKVLDTWFGSRKGRLESALKKHLD
jgi:thiol-disulfide isomerase/thioredoxin